MTLLSIYLVVAFIWGASKVEEPTWVDVIASVLTGLVWPVITALLIVKELKR